VSRGLVSAIVVTRNNRETIQRTLDSLRQSSPSLHEIIVLDHDSDDGTADVIRRAYPDVILLDFLDNPGFGAGNNRGARIATGDYLLLLNPDAIVERDCVERLVHALEADAHAAIAAPKVLLASEPSIINSAGLAVNRIGYGWDRGYLEWDRGQYDTPGPVLAASGCALLVRSDVFRSLGGFDEVYFLYYEDLDLCWRSWLAGYRVTYVPDAGVRHAMKITNRPLLYSEYLDHRNRLRTLAKVLSRRSLARLAPRLAVFEAGSAWALARAGCWPALRFRAQTWAWHTSHLRDTWRQRRRAQRTRTTADAALEGLFDPGTGPPQLKSVIPTYPVRFADTVEASQLPSALSPGSNDSGALGLGWHAPEIIHGARCRWSSGYGIAFLRAPGTRRAKVRVTCHAPPGAALEVRIDRQCAGRFVLNGGGWEEVGSPAACVGDVLRVDILPASTFRPSDGDPTRRDDRMLGVAVSRISCDPC